MKNPIPKHIGKQGRQWLKTAGAEYHFSPFEWKTAVMCAECVDTISDCTARIKAEGLTVTDRFGQVKAHPLLTTVRDQKACYKNLLRQLGLDQSEPEGLRLP